MDQAERDRYSRQILFAGIGEKGHEALLQSHAVIVGCGALGSFHAGALARAGVGRLSIIDRDYVEPSNLQRQWLFEEQDAADALPKAVAAERRLKRINSSVQVRALVTDLTAANAADCLGGASVILDGTDNFETRFLVNDFAVRNGIPWIYGAAVGSYGITMPVVPGFTPCLRCVYPNPPSGAQPTCETAGILGVAVSVIASLQVAAALRILCQADLHARLATVDVWTGALRQIELPERDPECPACARREFPYLEESERPSAVLCGRNAVQIRERDRPLDLAALAADLARAGEVRANEFALRLLVPPYEMTIFADGRAIIKGTSDIGVARSLYARYVG